MGEPWASMGDVDQLGLPSAHLAMAARADAREVAAERVEQAERAARAEDRQQVMLWAQYQRALAEGREGVDLNRPETYVLTPDELATRVFDEQDRESARNDRRALIDAGLLHVLNVPADEMTSPATPEPEPAPPTPVEAARSRETGYVRMRVARFFRDLADARATHSEKART